VSFSLLKRVDAGRFLMPPAADHALHALAFAPHAKLAVGFTPTGPQDVLIVIGGYVLVLLVLVIFGLLGWQWQKPGGNGGGGGGSGRPPGQDLPPPGGQELRPDDPPPGLIEDDFATWERQLQSTEEPSRREDEPAAVPRR
jgi:hypothetical protein